jgi:GT2 family glycosyltransferase
MDTMYSPFYWEDIDLAYRAQTAGWKILWEPTAKVIHQHEATIGKFFGNKQKNWVAERNQILFFWKNISSPRFWLLHFLWLPTRLWPPGRWIPLILAVSRMPLVLLRRLKGFGRRKISDEEILAKFN